MKRVKIGRLKDQLSAHLRAVEAGAEVEVTDRDRPIARIVPVAAEGEARLRILPALRPFATLRRMRFRPTRWAIDSTTLLRHERGDR
jgi:antitoxin (DNA-binding transcriptional repressor) of toxin-antitoxin stability system